MKKTCSSRKKNPGILYRLDRYLYKNSYFYKWGKIVWRSPAGKIVLAVACLIAVGYSGFRIVETHQIKRFVRQWQEYQNRGDWEKFSGCLDLSESNPYHVLFPDWRSEFFSVPRRLEISRMQVFRISRHRFRIEASIRIVAQNEGERKFSGVIYVQKTPTYTIFRVET